MSPLFFHFSVAQGCAYARAPLSNPNPFIKRQQQQRRQLLRFEVENNSIDIDIDVTKINYTTLDGD